MGTQSGVCVCVCDRPVVQMGTQMAVSNAMTEEGVLSVASLEKHVVIRQQTVCLQAISAGILWPVHVHKVPQASGHICPAMLQTRCDFAVLVSLSARSFPLMEGRKAKVERGRASQAPEIPWQEVTYFITTRSEGDLFHQR